MKVSVVIPTVDRAHLLRRAITSIENQDYIGEIEIIVVTLDANSEVLPAIEAVVRASRITCTHCVLSLDEELISANPILRIYQPARIAHQRNAGIAVATGDVIAHLDDDNEYLASHISSLVHLLDHSPDLPAVHSWRYILRKDGSPFTDNIYPWIKQPNRTHAQHIFDDLIVSGGFRGDANL